MKVLHGKTIVGAGYRKIEAAIFISLKSDRPNGGMWVLGFGLKCSLIHKIMTTSGSIFLAVASRGVGHQIARILATQNLPVLALIRWRSLPEVITCCPIRSSGYECGNGGG